MNFADYDIILTVYQVDKTNTNVMHEYNKLLKQLLLISEHTYEDDDNTEFDMTIHCCKLQLKDVTKILKYVKKIQKQMNKYDEYACFHVLVQL